MSPIEPVRNFDRFQQKHLSLSPTSAFVPLGRRALLRRVLLVLLVQVQAQDQEVTNDDAQVRTVE
jgi:hypothetical protein